MWRTRPTSPKRRNNSVLFMPVQNLSRQDPAAQGLTQHREDKRACLHESTWKRATRGCLMPEAQSGTCVETTEYNEPWVSGNEIEHRKRETFDGYNNAKLAPRHQPRDTNTRTKDQRKQAEATTGDGKPYNPREVRCTQIAPRDARAPKL